MKSKPGRRSANDRSSAATVVIAQRPKPPSDLSADEAREWTAALAPLPADWVSGAALSLLADWCRSTVRGRRIARLLAAMERDGRDESEPRDYLALLRESERQARLSRSLASALRMTPQSRYDRHAAGAAARKGSASKPWDRGQ